MSICFVVHAAKVPRVRSAADAVERRGREELRTRAGHRSPVTGPRVWIAGQFESRVVGALE